MQSLLSHILTTTLLTTAFCSTAWASSPSNPAQLSLQTETEIGLNETQDGSLLFKTDRPGRYLKAPMVSTDVKMDIAGPVIRTTLSQTFKNTCLLYTSPSPRDKRQSRMPSSA